MGIAFFLRVKDYGAMKIGVSLLGIVGMCALSGSAFAQQTPPPRVGFQMAFRTGYSVPMGEVAKDEKMSDGVSGQVPIIVDIGGKVIPELFIGGYFGLGFGGTAGQLQEECKATDQTCVAVSAQLGIEAQYHILPAGSVNPWLGYGLGFESLAVSIPVDGATETRSLGGFQFARLSDGVDFRVNRGFGVGPFVEYSLGQYSSNHFRGRDIDIPNKSGHQWLTFGVRFVLFP
jgi:hypothetical protein